VAHPPGYPLFLLLGRLAGAIPVGSIATRVNALSAVCDAAAAGLLTFAVARLSGSAAGGLLAGGLFAFSSRVWAYATVGEVFALNNLVVAALLVTLGYAGPRATTRHVGIGAALMGLGLANHHTSIFVSTLGWFPRINSKIYPWDDPWEHFRNFFLPVLTLSLPIAAVFTRLLRADMIIALQSDFVTLARAKGVSPRRILWRHALRSSLLSLVTSVGLQVGGLLGAAVAVETLFEVDGLGSLLFESIQRRDFLVVQACVSILVITVVFANFFVDLLYAVIDPRIRHVRALG